MLGGLRARRLMRLAGYPFHCGWEPNRVGRSRCNDGQYDWPATLSLWVGAQPCWAMAVQ